MHAILSPHGTQLSYNCAYRATPWEWCWGALQRQQHDVATTTTIITTTTTLPLCHQLSERHSKFVSNHDWTRFPECIHEDCVHSASWRLWGRKHCEDRNWVSPGAPLHGFLVQQKNLADLIQTLFKVARYVWVAAFEQARLSKTGR